jgi:hypothetical protein
MLRLRVVFNPLNLSRPQRKWLLQRIWRRFLGIEGEADLTREMAAEDCEMRADGSKCRPADLKGGPAALNLLSFQAFWAHVSPFRFAAPRLRRPAPGC